MLTDGSLADQVLRLKFRIVRIIFAFPLLEILARSVLVLLAPLKNVDANMNRRQIGRRFNLCSSNTDEYSKSILINSGQNLL